MASFLDQISSHGPEAKVLTREQAERSVVVSNIAPKTQDKDIVIYFQGQKNGGGDIDRVHVPDKGTAVVTFDRKEVVTRVLERPHTIDGSKLKLCRLLPTEARQVFKEVKARVNFGNNHLLSGQSDDMLEIVKENTGVAYRKECKDHFMTGTFDQIVAAHKLLQCLVCQEIKRAGEVTGYRDNNANVQQDFSCEVQPQFMKLLKRVFDNKIQEIEEQFCVQIICDENKTQVSVRPSTTTTRQSSFHEGCDEFIDLYQKFILNIGREEVELPKGADAAFIHKAVTKSQAIHPMIIEKTEKNLVVYAEKKSIKRSVYSLKEELGLTNKRSSTGASRIQGNKLLDAYEDKETSRQGQHSLTQQLKHDLSNGVKLSLYQGDITDEQVDAIVNAANEWLQHGGGVADAIVRKGGHQIQDESTCFTRQHGPLNVGKATYTNAGKLACRYVIHTVGPEWRKHGKEKSKAFLHQACIESLHIAAMKLNLSSIAITAISSGIFGMPKDICAQVMLSAVEAFSSSEDAEFSTLRDVRIVIIDEPTISVFQAEFVKRYLSKDPSPQTTTTQKRLPSKPISPPPTPHSAVDGRSDLSPARDQTQGNNNAPEGQREQNSDGNYLSKDLSPKKPTTQKRLPDKHIAPPPTPHSAVDGRNDLPPAGDQTQGNNNSPEGQGEQNSDGNSLPNNVLEIENSGHATVPESMSQGTLSHQATDNLKKAIVPIKLNEPPNEKNDRGRRGNLAVSSPHSEVDDEQNDPSLPRDQRLSDDTSSPRGKREENRNVNSPSNYLVETKSSADGKVPDSTKQGSLSHQANVHLKNANESSDVKEPPGITEESNKSVPVEGFNKSDGCTDGKSKFGRGRDVLAPTFQNSPGKEKLTTPNGSTYLERTFRGHGRGRGFTTTSSPPGLTMTKEGKHLAQFHGKIMTGDQNGAGPSNKEGENHESSGEVFKKANVVQDSKCDYQDTDVSNPNDDSSKAMPTEQQMTDQSRLINHQDLKNHLTRSKAMPNMDESVGGSGEYVNDESREFPSVPNTENTKPISDQPTENDTVSPRDPLIFSVREEEMQTAVERSGRGNRPLSEMQGIHLKREPSCSMCMNFNNDLVYTSNCGRGHHYCKSCVKRSYEKPQSCPRCQKEGFRRGNQPVGCMTWKTDTQNSLPGYEDFRVTIMNFMFEEGVQGPEHPNPGKRYSPLYTTAFLPHNSEGEEVCSLLRRAFDARLLFTIGKSPTTGEENKIIWNGIELKTSRSGGPASYGYPDPSYIDRVKKQLAEKGITPSQE